MSDCDLLVTGARGFVGRHVLDRARAAGLDAREAHGDLREDLVADEQIAAARPRAVVHLAAAPRGGNPWAALAADVAMAGAVVRAVARHAPDAPLLVAGSAAQYGIGHERPLAETDAVAPVSAYGVQKCVIESAVLAPSLRGDVRVIFTRSFNHIGPGQGPDAPAGQWAREIVAAEAAGGGTIRIGDLTAVRDFLDVRDVADAYLALVRSPAAGVVNVCSGVPVAVGDVLQELLRASPASLELRPDPALMRRVDPPWIVGDPARLRALTDWSARVPLRRSAADLLAACRRELDPSAGSVPAVAS
jgi:GDP-4-dehydro-6-deoxy-D-mannose reductase